MSPNVNGSMSTSDILKTYATSLQPVEIEDLDSTQPKTDSSGTEIYDAKAEGWETIANGTFVDSKKFKDQNLLAEMPKTPPKTVDYDLSTPTGARDALLENSRRLKERYIDRAGIEGAIKTAREALEKMPKSPEKKVLAEKLDALAAEGENIIADREKLTRFLVTEKRAVKNMNASPADIVAMAKRDLKDAAVALRNFEYDLNRTHGKYGKFGKFKNFMSQTFTTTRNSFFRAVQNKVSDLKAKITGRKGLGEMQLLGVTKDKSQQISSQEIHNADKRYDKFSSDLKEFARLVKDSSIHLTQPETGEASTSMSEFRTNEALQDFKAFKGVLYSKAKGGNDPYSVIGNLTELFKRLAAGGESSQSFVLDLKAGVALPVPVGADVSVSGKYQYSFTVSTKDGMVSVESIHAGGAEAEASVGKGNVKTGGKASVLAGTGSRTEYVSPESAANALASGKLGPLYNFFLNGMGAGVKSAVKRIHMAATKQPSVSEGAYVQSAKDRGLLNKTDTVKFRSPNSAFVEDVTFTRVGVEAGAEAKFEAIIKANASAGASIQKDINAQRTQYRSYYQYFTADRKGEAGSVYFSVCDKKGTIDDPAKMRDLLDRQPETEADKKQLATDILNELKAMRGREQGYTRDLLLRDKRSLPTAGSVCEACRIGTTALVALMDKLETLGLGPDAGLGKELSQLTDELRDNLQSPRGMAMSKKELLAGLYVNREYKESATTIKFHLGAGVDVVSGGFNKLSKMANSDIANIVIAPTKAAVTSVLGAPSVDADVTVQFPKGNDPRPYRNQTVITADLSFKGDLSGKAIVAAIQDKLRASAEKAQLSLKEQNISAKSILMGMAQKAKVAGIDVLEDTVLAAMSDEEAEDAIFKTFSETSRSGKVFASIKVEDGRIASIGIGSSKSEASTYGANIAFVKVSAKLATATKIVTDTIHIAPSFDSLTSKCEHYRLIGHNAEFNKLAMDNKHAFLRMAKIAGGVPPKDDANAADDLQRMERTIHSMIRDVEHNHGKNQQARLQANLNEFMAAWVELQQHYASAGADDPKNDQKVVGLMCTMLRAATDHYNIVESVGGYGGAIGIDQMKNLNESIGGANNDFVIADWKKRG